MAKSAELKKLDAQLDHWAATAKAHDANLARIERDYRSGKHARSEDKFDVNAYQKMIYGKRWNA